MYFAFLSFYMRFLVAPALGVLSFFVLGAFSPLYSIGLLIGSLTFVKWWAIKEGKLSRTLGRSSDGRDRPRRSRVYRLFYFSACYLSLL